ncbi:MAG: radical SAM protein, partial [Candidatus Brocadiales bacterium]|nr:radical SAM protein [Candidatus Brocadiales bacterium]
SGEGEYALLELIRQIKDNSLEPDRLENVGFLEDGQVVYTKPSTKMMDVNALPMFPYDMFNPEHYDLGFILTSRGCPFDCIFCSQRAITKRVYRYVSSERVIEELGYLINEMKRPSVAFFDDYFTGNRERVLELCTLIQERGFHRRASFGVQTRGDSIDKELMVAMRAANFTSLMFGVETASEDLMKLINKKETVQENIDAIRLAKELGFEADATFIFGFPTETFEDRLAALSLAVENGIDRARFNNVVPYPGTQLFKTVKEQLKIAPQWANFSADRAATASIRKKYPLPFVPEGCSEEELEGSIFLANLLFYLNFNKLKKLFNPGEGASGKWFGVSWRELLSPGVVFSLLMLAGTVLLRTFYYLLTDRNCLRFFLKGLRVCLNPGQFSNSRKPTVGTEGYSKNF